MTEEELGIAMLELARSEGHRANALRNVERKPRKASVTKRAGPETLAAVKLLCQRPMTSPEIAEIIGIPAGGVSSRLASLCRAEVVQIVEKRPSGKYRQTRCTWGVGPRVGEWLARYGRKAMQEAAE